MREELERWDSESNMNRDGTSPPPGSRASTAMSLNPRSAAGTRDCSPSRGSTGSYRFQVRNTFTRSVSKTQYSVASLCFARSILSCYKPYRLPLHLRVHLTLITILFTHDHLQSGLVALLIEHWQSASEVVGLNAIGVNDFFSLSLDIPF